MNEQNNMNLYSIIENVDQYEDDSNKFSNVFVDMLKNEIDATDEPDVYNNLKKMIYKYKDNHDALDIIDEIIEAISDGAKLSEILLIAKDEIENPIPTNAMNLDEFNIPNYE